MLATLLFLFACAGPAKPAPTLAPIPLCSGSYCVEGAFADYYRQHAALLGPPISGPLVFRERLVQYFAAGRVELVPENPPGYEVGLAYLGEEVCGRQPPLHHSDVPSYLEPDARYFPETGHSLRGDFLRFFTANGAADFFGPPISEERFVGEETVQDFLRVQLRRRAARARPSDGEVYLVNLGELVRAGTTPPAGMCPSIPADDPDAEAGQADGGEHD